MTECVTLPASMPRGCVLEADGRVFERMIKVKTENFHLRMKHDPIEIPGQANEETRYSLAHCEIQYRTI